FEPPKDQHTPGKSPSEPRSSAYPHPGSSNNCGGPTITRYVTATKLPPDPSSDYQSPPQLSGDHPLSHSSGRASLRRLSAVSIPMSLSLSESIHGHKISDPCHVSPTVAT
ncbi:unnamed protein product, partial [Brassica rapa]